MFFAFFFLLFLGWIPKNALSEPKSDYSESYRPQFHYTPPLNWMNDPNGLIYYNQVFHLFYQYNPYGNVWGHMSWGHAISTDLVRWVTLDPALLEEDNIMIFSGCAITDEENVSGLVKPSPAAPILLFYTGYGNNKQDQNVAFSIDQGNFFLKFYRIKLN